MTEPQTGMDLTPAEQTAVARQEDGPGGRRSEVMDLIRFALADDVGVEKLERLMALKEREDAKAARAEYLEAVRSFQAACPAIPKRKGVSFDDRPGARVAYHYAPLEDITRVIDPILRRNGLSYSWTTAGIEGGMLNVICTLRHTGGHEEQVPFPTPTATKGKMSAAQMNGAALTYGRRQSLIAILGLTTTDDDLDGVDAVEREVETVTDSQAADLDALIDEVGADRAKVLAYFQVGALSDLPAHRLDEAIRLLEQRRSR